MQRLIFLLQILLKSTMIFLLAFIWLRFIFSSIWLASAIAFAITLIIELISLNLKRRSKNKANLKLKEKEDAENMFLSLASANDSLSFFYNLALSRHKNCEKKEDYILIKHSKNNVVLYPFLKISKLSPDEIMAIYKKSIKDNPEKIVITCNEYDKNCLSFIKNFSKQILILDKFESYSALYREYDFFPEITLEFKKEAKLSFKDLIAYSFNKFRTKGYLFSALILLSSTFFIKQTLYYCITASLLLIFAIISFVNPKYNSKKQQETLLL